MADSIVLYGPGGASPLQLASWYQINPGPDFGQAGLFSAALSKNPWSEGNLQLESSNLRHMKIPLLVGSHSAFGGMLVAESMLRKNAVKDGYLDVQPDGVPSAEAIRFDILAGRWNPDYDVYLHRVSRRKGTLELDTDSYGYWPTTMILASAASVGLPGFIAVLGASIIGDVPPLMELSFQATTATQFESFYGTYAHDMLAWSLSGRASFQSFWRAASLTVVGAASLYTDGMAPGSQGLAVVGTSNNWIKLTNIAITSALEPAYRGAHRAYAWMGLGPSQGGGLQVAADAVSASFSANVPYPPGAPAVATVAPNWGSSSIAVPTMYQLVDLGVVEIPAVGSGNAQAVDVRLWGKLPIVGGYTPTPLISIAGMFLLPQPNSAYMPQGWYAPTVAATDGTPARLTVDGINSEARLEAQIDNLASHIAVGPAAQYRGQVAARGLPSTVQLDLLGAGRKVGLEAGHVHDYTNEPAGQLFYYRFPSGSYMQPFTPVGVNSASWGATGVVPSAASIGAPGPLNQPMLYVGGTGYAVASSLPMVASDFTFGIWVQRATFIGSHMIAAALGTMSSNRGFQLGIGTGPFYMSGAGAVNMGSGAATPLDASYHFLAVSFSRASALAALYYDGSYMGAFAQSAFTAAVSIMLMVGRSASGAIHHWNGGLGEIYFNSTKALSQDRIYQMWQAGVSPTNTPSGPPVKEGIDFAAVSVRYRPQFQFLKGI